MEKSKNYVMTLESEVKNCSVEIYINDIPVTMIDHKTSPQETLSISEYLIDGKNKLLLVINPGQTPNIARSSKKKKTKTSGMTVKAKISKYPEGTFPDDPSGIIQVDINWQGKDKEILSMPLEVEKEFNIGKWHGEWSWTKAETLKLDNKTLSEINNIIKKLHKSLSKKDPEILLAFQSIKLREINKAFNIDQSTEPKETRDWLQEEFKAEDWEMETINPSNYDIRLCADNKMVDLVAKDWNPILRSKKNKKGNQLLFDIKLIKLNGKFNIVR